MGVEQLGERRSPLQPPTKYSYERIMIYKGRGKREFRFEKARCENRICGTILDN